MRNILFVGAHCDDLDINCGGTIARFCQDLDKNVFCYIPCAHFSSYDHIRSDEQIESLHLLGVKLESIFFGNYEDTKMYLNIPNLVSDIDGLIKSLDIDTVFTHRLTDNHQDHWAVSKAVLASSRLVKNVVHFRPTYPSSSSGPAFDPNLLVSLSSDHIDLKMKALSCHKSQIDKYGSDEWINKMIKIAESDSWIYGNRHQFAEVFEVGRLRI